MTVKEEYNELYGKKIEECKAAVERNEEDTRRLIGLLLSANDYLLNAIKEKLESK